MVLAIAALLFQLSPTPAVTAPVESADPASGTFALNLPDTSSNVATGATAPEGSSSTPEPITSAESGGRTHGDSSAPLNAASFTSAMRNSDSLSAIRISEQDSGKPFRFVSPESWPSRPKWIALSIAQHAAATFDAYSTRMAITQGAIEADPFMRPFANSSAMYAAIQVSPVVLDLAARHMQRSQNNLLRRTWWVPQSVATVMFLFSGVHNFQVAGQLR
jgi:hypothetical protein